MSSHVRFVARITTIFALLVLISLSFTVLFSHQDGSLTLAATARSNSRFFVKRDSQSSSSTSSSIVSSESSSVSSDTSKPSSTSTSSPTTTTSSSPTSSSTPLLASSSSSSSSSTPTDTPTSSSSSSLFSSSSSSSIVNAVLSTTSSTSSSSTSTTSTRASSTTSTSHSSSKSSSSSSSSSTSITGTTMVVADQSDPTSYPTDNVDDYPAYTSSSVSSAPSTTSSSSSSSSATGFFQNTGAVAATFTVVALVGVGVVAAGVFYYMKRRRVEDIDIFNDQFGGPGFGHPEHGGSAEYFGPVMSEHDAEPVMHAAPDAYPDRHIHYGQSNFETNAAIYAGQEDLGLDFPPALGGGSYRDSTASNHAGFGVYQTSPDHQAPVANQNPFDDNDADIHISVEPAIGEELSPYLQPTVRESHQTMESYNLGDSHTHNVGAAR